MAKKNEVEVGVKVTDKGSLKETGNKAKKAGKGLGEVGANAAGADRAMKGLSAQSSNSTKNFSKMSQGLTGGLVPAYAVLAANIFALGAAFRFLSNAADYRILIEGQREYSTITGESLKLLTSRLQAATEGQLAFGEASQSVAIARAAGITADQIGRLGTLAKNASIALGRDLTDSLNRLIRGATKGEPELLDELGIILRLEVAAKKYAAQIGKSAEQLSIFEKSQAVTNEVLEQGERKFQDFQTEVNQFGKMLKSFDDLLNSLKKTLAALFEPIATGLSKNVTALAGAFVLLGSSILKSLTPAIPAMNMGVVGKDAMSNIGNVYTAKGRGARFQAGTATSADITAFEKSLKSKHSTVIKYEVLKRGEMQKTVAIVKAYRQQMDADQAVGMKKIYLQWKANLALMQAEYGKFVGAIKILQRGLLGLVGAAGWISLIVTGISLLSGWFSKGTEEQEKFNDKQRQTVDLLKEQAEETARLTREMKNMKNIVDQVNQVGGFFGNFDYEDSSTFGEGTQYNSKQDITNPGWIARWAELLVRSQMSAAGMPESMDNSDNFGLTNMQRQILESTSASLKEQMGQLSTTGTGGKGGVSLHSGVKATRDRIEEILDMSKAGEGGIDLTTYKELLGILDLLAEKGTEAARKLAPFAKTMQTMTGSFSEMTLALNKLKTSSTGLTVMTKAVGDTGQAFRAIITLMDEGDVESISKEFAGKENSGIGDYENIVRGMLGDAAVDKIIKGSRLFDQNDKEFKEGYKGKTKKIIREIAKALEAEEKRMAKVEKDIMIGKTKLQAEYTEQVRGVPKLLAAQIKKHHKIADIGHQIFKTQALIDEMEKKGADKDAVQLADDKEKLRLLEAQLEIAKDEASLINELKMGVLDTFASGLQTAIDGLIQGTVTVKEAFSSMAKSVLQMISKILAKMAALKVLEFMFPGTDFTKYLASGGYMQGKGQPKVPGYKYGGVATEPTYMVGEGKYNEAVVPLPDGRSIPVQMKGGSGNANVTVNISSDGQTTSSMSANGGEQAAQLGRAISTAVQEELLKQQRPGGMLSPYGV